MIWWVLGIAALIVALTVAQRRSQVWDADKLIWWDTLEERYEDDED